MTDQDFQTFVVEKLTSLDTRLGSVEEGLTSLDTKVTSLDTKVTSLDTKVTSLDTKVTSLEREVHGLRDEFSDFREEQRQENAVLRALSAQSFQHISDIKAEMIPTWKAGNAWKAKV